MNPFRRKPKPVRVRLTSPDGGPFEAMASPRAAAAIAALRAEIDRLKAASAEITAKADDVSRTATAMRDAFHGEIEALNNIVRGLNEAVATERNARQKAQVEVVRLDAELVKTGFDLGRERDEHRATRRELAAERNTKAVTA